MIINNQDIKGRCSIVIRPGWHGITRGNYALCDQYKEDNQAFGTIRQYKEPVLAAITTKTVLLETIYQVAPFLSTPP